VIHYQLPASVDIYVHRSGRTARADAEGVAISLVCPKEKGRFIALQVNPSHCLQYTVL
jgi:ATP-dependent RNA helicase DDX24/MAK5